MKSDENDTNLTSCCLGSMICRKTKTSALAVDESFFFFAFLFSIFTEKVTFRELLVRPFHSYE